MKMNMNGWLRYVLAATMTLAALMAMHRTAGAQNVVGEITRDKKWDVYILGQNLTSEEIEYRTNSGLVPITMSPTPMGGFGFGYHFMKNFAWRFEGAIGYPTFTGHGPASGTTRDVALHTGMLNFDWFMLDKRVSPYFTAGLGWQYIYAQTSNIGAPVAYWDPWYGYTVGVAYPGHSETDFLWTLGLGLRWDVSQHFFLKLAADSNWVDFSKASKTINQIRYGLTLGMMY
jgi:opacity protein-like surface antigen